MCIRRGVRTAPPGSPRGGPADVGHLRSRAVGLPRRGHPEHPMSAAPPVHRRFPLRARIGRSRRGALHGRLVTLLTTLEPETTPGWSVGALLRQAAGALSDHDPEKIWLALAIMTTQLPEADTVVSLRRLGELDGPDAMLAESAQADDGVRLRELGRHDREGEPDLLGIVVAQGAGCLAQE